ncbi:hypothetical protein ACFLFF_30395 [Brevibacillus reuszeri]|uniref:hypothetical protein n=1 Tax=Brevibacillus reuszeri TaxID=54915 RepID=UPI0036713CE1
MWMGIGLIGLVAAIITALLLIFSAIKKNSAAAKKRGIFFVASLTVFIVGVSLGNGKTVESTIPKNEVKTNFVANEKSKELRIETIGVGASEFKHKFNAAAKGIGFKIQDDKFKPSSETEYLKSYKLKLDDNLRLTFDVDKQNSEIQAMIISGNVEYKEENIGTLIRLMDATISGVDDSTTHDDRNNIIKQLGFDVSDVKDVQSLDKSFSHNGLKYTFISAKDGEVGFSIYKDK